MNNQELELKIKEILEIENFFDMVEHAVEFEKEYKTTEFYKKTKMPLMDVIKNAKMWYVVQFSDLTNKIQKMINNLDFDSINQIFNQLGDVYAQENEDTLNIFKEFKELVR